MCLNNRIKINNLLVQMQKFNFDLDNLTSIFIGSINFKSLPKIRSLFSSGWEDFSGGIPSKRKQQDKP